MHNSQDINRPSIRKHHQQRFWQIILPIILISLIVLLGGGFFVIKGGPQTRIWSDVSIIWLILPLLGILLLTLAILIGMIILTFKVNQRTPIYTNKIQQIFNKLKDSSLKVTDSTVRPIFWIRQTQSGIARIFKSAKRNK